MATIPKSTRGNSRQSISQLASLLHMGQQCKDCDIEYWSPQYDRHLMDLYNNNEWVQSAITQVHKPLCQIEFTIKPRDANFKSHVRQAEEFQAMWDAAWGDVKQQFILSMLIQCNPGVLGAPDIKGNYDKERKPAGNWSGFRYFMSNDVVRKSDMVHPVAVKVDGKQYPIHASKVFSIVDTPSADTSMNGVGSCALHRMAKMAKHLANIAQLNEEYIGDTPMKRALLIFSEVYDGKVFDDDLEAANDDAENDSTLVDILRALIIPDSNARVEEILDKKLPDGFNAKEEFELVMKMFAAALNVDLRQIWDKDSNSLGGKGDSEVTSETTNNKLFGWFIDQVKSQAERVLLPPTLTMTADYADDAQDEKRATIELKEAQAAVIRKDCGLTDTRNERLREVMHGHLSQSEFDRLELEDGRMSDGKSVTNLFCSDEYIDDLAIAGIDDPLNISAATPESLVLLDARIRDAKGEAVNAKGPRQKQRFNLIYAALVELRKLYAAEIEAAEDDAAVGEDDAIDNQDDGATDADTDESKAVKAIDAEVDQYEARLIAVADLVDEGRITEAEGEERITNLARAMLVIAFYDGKYDGDRDGGTESEQAIVDAAESLLANRGLSRVDIPERQQARYVDDAALVDALNGIDDDEVDELRNAFDIHADSANGLINETVQRSEKAIGSAIRSRIRIWARKARELFNLGKLYNPLVESYTWQLGATEQHCATCLAQSGVTRTKAEWRDLAAQGVKPQGGSLDCGGWNCDCTLVKA